MSLQASHSAIPELPDGASMTELRLGQLLTLIHRVLPKLDEPARQGEVLAALHQAAGLLEAARQALVNSSRPAPPASHRVATEVAPEIAAVIAAAVAVLFDRPYRLVSVQHVTTPAPHLNVWALEGRTQIFQSHKIR